MKKEWSKMTPAEKKWIVPLCIYVVVGIVFAVLDISGTWKNEIFRYMIVAFCFVEGVVEWKKNWKMALLDFAVAVFFLLNALGL